MPSSPVGAITGEGVGVEVAVGTEVGMGKGNTCEVAAALGGSVRIGGAAVAIAVADDGIGALVAMAGGAALVRFCGETAVASSACRLGGHQSGAYGSGRPDQNHIPTPVTPMSSRRMRTTRVTSLLIALLARSRSASMGWNWKSLPL